MTILFNSYKIKLEDGAEIKPYIPLLNNRIYDTKFESQFYMISDSNKVSILFLILCSCALNTSAAMFTGFCSFSLFA